MTIPTLASKDPMANLMQRAVIALTLGPLALYLIYLGGYFYFIPLTLILLLATYEYTQLMRQLGWLPAVWLMLPAVLAVYAAAQWFDTLTISIVMVIALLLAMVHALWLYETREDGLALPTWLAMSLGLVLLGWLASHFFRVRELEGMAWQWTMILFLSTWIADSAAYVVGRFMAGSVLGKHQLAPRLSPNKTVEGYIGGIVLGTGLTVGVAYVLGLPLAPAGLLALLIALIGPLGDLGISLLKREAGVKDSGRTFGSHGGALDRVDSLIWSGAIAFYLITLLP